MITNIFLFIYLFFIFFVKSDSAESLRKKWYITTRFYKTSKFLNFYGLMMTSSWICPNNLICQKFDDWNQSDSDSTLNFDVKQSIKSTGQESGRFNGFQQLSCWTIGTCLFNISILNMSNETWHNAACGVLKRTGLFQLS